MNDIELVIKIPENTYDECNGNVYFPDTGAIVWDAVSKGTPLPKKHGRLIDADAFIEQESCCGYIEDMDIDYFKQNTPTIIEADKGEEE